MKNTLILLMILFISCEKKTDSLNNIFEKFELKKIKSISLQDLNLNAEFSYLFSLKFIDDLLIISDNNSDFHMKIADLKNKNTRNFVQIGRGPNEIGSQGYSYTTDIAENKLYITGENKCLVYSIAKLKRGNDDPIGLLNIKLNEESFMHKIYIGGNYVFGSLIQNRFGLYNFVNKKLIKKYEYDLGPLLNQCMFSKHPTRNQIAFLEIKNASLGVVSYDSIDFKLHEKKWWKSKSKEVGDGVDNIEIIPSKERRTAFISHAISEKYIYSLYSGKKINYLSPYDALQSNKIYVFDWEGNPIKRFELDKEVRSIAIDEKNNILYAGAIGEDGELSLSKI